MTNIDTINEIAISVQEITFGMETLPSDNDLEIKGIIEGSREHFVGYIIGDEEKVKRIRERIHKTMHKNVDEVIDSIVNILYFNDGKYNIIKEISV